MKMYVTPFEIVTHVQGSQVSVRTAEYNTEKLDTTEEAWKADVLRVMDGESWSYTTPRDTAMVVVVSDEGHIHSRIYHRDDLTR